MSREDVELLERVYARWGTGRFDTPEVFHPDIEVRWSPHGLDTAGTTRGLQELMAMLRRWFEGLEDVRFEAERFADRGDQVLVVVLMRGRGRGSGIDVAERFGHLWTFRDGKAIRLEDASPEATEGASAAQPPAQRRNAAALRGFFVELNAAMAGDGDLDDVAGRYMQPDVVSELGLVEGTVRGPGGFANYIRGQLSVVDEMRIDPLEFVELDDRVVMPFRLHGRSRHSGLPLSFEYTQLFTMSDGRIAHVRMYRDKPRALEAARSQRVGRSG